MAWARTSSILAILLLAVGCGQRAEAPVPSATPCEDVNCVVETAVDLLQREGVVAAVAYAEREGVRLESGTPGACHTALHGLGSVAAQLDAPPPATTSALVACSGGFYHGLLAGYGSGSRWPEAAIAACAGFAEEEGTLCRHGYGHGAAAGGDGAGIEQRCAEVAETEQIVGEGVSVLELCSDGAFMEIVQQAEAGEIMRPEPASTCSRLEGWMAWGCWRQLGMLLDTPEAVDRYARQCPGLDAYLADACAVGVAEAVVARNLDAGRSCEAAGDLAARCLERVRGRLGN